MKRGIALLLLGLGLAGAIGAENAIVPGDVNSLCYYDNFFYNLPERDFLFYFNDALLFTEPPDDNLYRDGMRDKFLRLVRRHKLVREFIVANGNPQNATISFDLKDPGAFGRAVTFMALLGLDLARDPSGALRVAPAAEDPPLRYFEFCGLKPSALQVQLQASNVFFFKLREATVPLPWDFAFLSAVSGLPLDSASVFETLIADKRFSLLLASLFRLSENEVAFIGRPPAGPVAPWQRIYQDKRTLMGLLFLSSALRARDGRLELPGGEAARGMWSALAGSDPGSSPHEFLASLCTLDDGKLNYFYVFSFFLPEEKRRVLFFDYDAAKVGRLYRGIVLGKNERLRAKAFPRLEDFGFFTLLQALKVEDGALRLPLGAEAWARAMGLPPPAGGDACAFLESLLAAPGNGGRKASLLHKFITVYSRFSDRSSLLTPEFLHEAFSGFESRSALWDCIDRIPLKDPRSASALLAWLDKLLNLGHKDRMLFTALGQALLETIAHAAAFATADTDFDSLVGELTAIPLRREEFCDGLFAFVRKHGDAPASGILGDESYLDFVLRGLQNRRISLKGETYEWQVRALYAADLLETLRSQEVCGLALLGEIHTLLNGLAEDAAGFGTPGRLLQEACERLPYPDFSADAPKALRERVLAYSREDLERDLQRLLQRCRERAGRDEIRRAAAAFKERYLLPLAKDHFLTLAYALNARSPKLRMFMNPNLIRLHDFSDNHGSPWQEGAAPGPKADFSGYYLNGSLSRLSFALAANWCGQLFEKNIFNQNQIQAMLYNLMAMLPETAANDALPDALLVELAVEMLSKCPDSESLRGAARRAASSLIAGYHYRQLDDFLCGRSPDYHLFYSEMRTLGDAFARDPLFLERFSLKEELAACRAGWGGGGNILFHSLGSHRPLSGVSLPPELAQWFVSGWLAGETLSEYKVKCAHLAYKNEMPFCLAGQFVFDFIATVARPYFTQNHMRDYHSPHFVLDVMNVSHLRSTLKKLQRSGFLRLK
ncbi:MAG: hypothetical protein JXO51_10350 [Candidatus Aminicenantes bacterium]|nr:hypothetical protein [Candidatus Aminicenantes bacterium]